MTSPSRIHALGGGFAANPIIYHLLIDRFLNTEPGRPAPYGRRWGDAHELAAYHGGNLAGITRKLNEGWFSALGVNALLLSAPYEQIHGWIADSTRTMRHYPYHGYYALDFTTLDHGVGTEDDLMELVRTAHGQGIRVLLDVVMNHPGYRDLQTLHDLGIGGVRDGWETATPATHEAYYDPAHASFADWWGPDWVRDMLPGYAPGGDDDLTRQIFGLPDFRTECTGPVELPRFLARKKDSRVRSLPDATVRDYLVDWLSAWVRDYGIDGFRCDSARHVDPASWSALKTACTAALAGWTAESGNGGEPFWMMGEVFGHGIGRAAYHDQGFDTLLNFDLQSALLSKAPLDPLYDDYARAVGGTSPHFVSYISSHDTCLFDRRSLRRGALALMLAPGGVMMFYGDESSRSAAPADWPGAADHGTRTDMNWDGLDPDMVAWWRMLGCFRARHVALAKGHHRRLSVEPYAFMRFDRTSGDLVVVVLDCTGGFQLDVAGIFREGEQLHCAATGMSLQAWDDSLTLPRAEVLLIERAGRDTQP